MKTLKKEYEISDLTALELSYWLCCCFVFTFVFAFVFGFVFSYKSKKTGIKRKSLVAILSRFHLTLHGNEVKYCNVVSQKSQSRKQKDGRMGCKIAPLAKT